MSTPQGSAAQPERRRSPRFKFAASLEIEWGSVTLAAGTRDISAEGMFIELADPLWIGARFSARLALQEPIAMEATVRRVAPGKGMGISFIPADEADRARLVALLDNLSKR